MESLELVITLALLRGSRERISDKEHWCQNTLAKDNEEEAIKPESYKARKWCALGSLQKSRADSQISWDIAVEAEGRLDHKAGRVGSWAISKINDCFGHSAVLKCYDEAIKDLELQLSGGK